MLAKLDDYIYGAVIPNIFQGGVYISGSSPPPFRLRIMVGRETVDGGQFNYQRTQARDRARIVIGVIENNKSYPSVICLYDKSTKTAEIFEYDLDIERPKIVVNALQRVLESHGGIRIKRTIGRPEVNISW